MQRMQYVPESIEEENFFNKFQEFPDCWIKLCCISKRNRDGQLVFPKT